MQSTRREFMVAGMAAAALPLGSATAAETPTGLLPASVRAEFPWVAEETFFDPAYYHPMSRSTAAAARDYLLFRERGGRHGSRAFDGASDTVAERERGLKERFARLIHASADEIAFVQSTSEGENLIIAGLGLAQRRGNVVLTDLHYHSSLYMYRTLERLHGLEVRVVPSRHGAVDRTEVERAVDRNTRLVSIALVSNVNGYLHDARTISDIAHAHGAYLYADVVQAVGAIPVDVNALGLDFCACSTYKWLMAERGFGFLFVRQALQAQLASARWGHRQYTSFDKSYTKWELVPGARRYFESGNISNLGAVCAEASLDYIERLGVSRIQAHAAELVARLQEELPRIGCQPLTPQPNPTPIVAFRVDDPAVLDRKLQDSHIVATVSRRRSQLRLSVSVFNNHQDIDHLLQVLTA